MLGWQCWRVVQLAFSPAATMAFHAHYSRSLLMAGLESPSGNIV
jgi:hypothetical protein